MEKIYPPRLDKLINIGEFGAKYKESLCPSSINELPSNYSDVQRVLNSNNLELYELEQSISLNHLAQPDDMRIYDFNLFDAARFKRFDELEVPLKALKLRCVKHRLDNTENLSTRTKSKKYNRNKYVQLDVNDVNESGDLKPFDGVLIYVRIFEPFTRNTQPNAPRKPRLSQEFIVLGDQKLSELRDKIYCQCKFGPFVDISDCYENVNNDDILTNDSTSSETIDNSGFFFIGNTFYNDTRQSDVDYSAETRKWMANQREIGPVDVKTMQDTCFNDLTIRLGYPYVYRHYCICEHILTFTDIRLIAPDDSLKREHYPILRIISNARTKRCMICGYKEAKFIVTESVAHIHEPALICKTCLLSYHYADGKKVGSFKLYRYYGNHSSQ